ncbi:hypothetical protein B0O99DRAFT_685055 [Bisporella sp. PMI_857]|nr:hypothetical protein B0O99DRAFT_685055 [Bisporella sp. PMI_857]
MAADAAFSAGGGLGGETKTNDEVNTGMVQHVGENGGTATSHVQEDNNEEGGGTEGGPIQQAVAPEGPQSTTLRSSLISVAQSPLRRTASAHNRINEPQSLPEAEPTTQGTTSQPANDNTLVRNSQSLPEPQGIPQKPADQANVSIARNGNSQAFSKGETTDFEATHEVDRALARAGGSQAFRNPEAAAQLANRQPINNGTVPFYKNLKRNRGNGETKPRTKEDLSFEEQELIESQERDLKESMARKVEAEVRIKELDEMVEIQEEKWKGTGLYQSMQGGGHRNRRSRR